MDCILNDAFTEALIHIVGAADTDTPFPRAVQSFM